MPVTPDDVRGQSLTGAFDAYTDDQVQPLIDEAALHMNEAAWNIDPDRPRYNTGLALLAAHLLAMEIASGTGGIHVVTSRRLGPAARTYAVAAPNPNDDPLNLQATRYGQRYQALLDNLPLTPRALWDGTC